MKSTLRKYDILIGVFLKKQTNRPATTYQPTNYHRPPTKPTTNQVHRPPTNQLLINKKYED